MGSFTCKIADGIDSAGMQREDKREDSEIHSDPGIEILKYSCRIIWTLQIECTSVCI